MYKIYVHCTVLNSINFLAHDINFMNSVYPDRGQLPKHVDRLLAQKISHINMTVNDSKMFPGWRSAGLSKHVDK